MSSNNASAEPVATVVSGHTFTVDTRYVLKDAKILGKGSFGVVTTAYDSVRKIDLAIKRIRPYANDEWDARHTLREIRLLKLLGNHPNIITLFELSLFEPKTELYMMMELMDCDLHRVIQSKQPLSEKHHKCFVKQILEGIRAMHSIGVFHRDLKPGNILVSKDCQLRITDFGLARFMDEVTRQGENQQNPMTEYVVTRWYRCPELLLSPNRPYDEAIDLWSIGCILAELLRRKPLFPGKSHANQVQLIFEVMGFNSVKEMGFPVSAEAASFLEKRCRGRKQPWSKLFPDATIQAVELLESLLMLNPTDRPTAQEALQYSFFGDAETLYDYSLDYLKPPPTNFFEFEMAKFTVPVLKEMIDNEVLLSSATNYRKPSIPTITVPSLSGRDRDQQPLSHPHSDSQTSRTDISSMSTAINPASSSHSSASTGGLASHAAINQPPRRNQPQNAVVKSSGAGHNNANGAKPIVGYRRLSSDGQGFVHHGSQEELTDGPVSQLSTQIRNFGVRGAGGNAASAVANQGDSGKSSHHGLASLNNPFRKQQTQSQAQPQPSSIAEGSLPNEAGAVAVAGALSQPPALIYAPGNNFSKSNHGDAAGDLAVEDDNHSVLGTISSGGNILTSARNEPMPANVAAMMKVASAKKTPKTPSPKKMEQILQMDLNNKRRFMMQGLQKQQQQLQIQGQNQSQGPAALNYSHNNVSANASLSAKMPPPSGCLPFHNRNGSKKEDIASSSSSVVIGSSAAASAAAAGNIPYNTRSSAAIIMNGGSNVIHNEYDIYANKKKQFTSADNGR